MQLKTKARIKKTTNYLYIFNISTNKKFIEVS